VLTINCWETREAIPDELIEKDPSFFAHMNSTTTVASPIQVLTNYCCNFGTT